MTIKLQIPIEQEVKDGLERRAHSLGFDSAQAYIRVWAKAEADGRSLDFDGKAVVLSSEASKRYEAMARALDDEKQAGTVETFTSVDDFMKDLV